jgi:hypothetical protein
MKVYRPTCSPPSTDSSKKHSRSIQAARRNAETGVSRSAAKVRQTGTSVCVRARARNSLRVGWAVRGEAITPKCNRSSTSAAAPAFRPAPASPSAILSKERVPTQVRRHLTRPSNRPRLTEVWANVDRCRDPTREFNKTGLEVRPESRGTSPYAGQPRLRPAAFDPRGLRSNHLQQKLDVEIELWQLERPT